MATKNKNKKNNEVVENISIENVNTPVVEEVVVVEAPLEEIVEDVVEEEVVVEENKEEILIDVVETPLVEVVELPLEEVKEEVKLSAKELFFNTLKDVRHYELTFRNNKVYDTVKDLGIIIPVPMDDVILIGNTYFPYSGLTINIK